MQNDNTYQEKALLRQVAEGNEQAFRVLFDTWSSKLYHYTLQLISSKESAEDIVQDSFLKIWLRRDRLDSIDNFSAYLFRMAQNAVTDGLRRRALESAVVESKMTQPEQEEELDTRLHLKLVKNVLDQAIKNLPGQQQKIFRLRREYGKRINEIAAELGISEITVKQHLNRAQASLRSELEKEFPLDGGILLIILGLLS